MSLAAWAAGRMKVLKSIALGSVTWPILFAIAWSAWPDVGAMGTPLERLTFALELAALPAVFLTVVVLSCMRLLQPVGAEDPFAGKESYGWRINARVVGNTVEQTLMFVPIIVALSLRIAPEYAKALPILVTLWVLGRVAFWIGYRISIYHRGVGFDWTMISLSVALIWLVSTYVR